MNVAAWLALIAPRSHPVGGPLTQRRPVILPPPPEPSGERLVVPALAAPVDDDETWIWEETRRPILPLALEGGPTVRADVAPIRGAR